MALYRVLRTNLLTQPYRALPAAVFAYVAISFLLHPHSPLHTFALGDPDDYMRLNETVNWLQGQGWYDLSHLRLSPGAHTVLHWSRLLDLPLAAFMIPLIKSFGMQKAALIASFIVPMILLAMALTLLPALAAPLLGEGRAGFASVFLLFAPMTLFNFTPGRVDHHGWEVLIAGFGLLCLERMTRNREGWAYAIFAALAFACGLWIGTEALPWVALFIGCLAVAGGWYGGPILRNGAVFGVAFASAVTGVLFLAVPRSEYFERALSWFSMADVIFAALSGFVLLIGWSLGQYTNNRVLRLALVGTAALFAALLFIYLVPDILAGPFADLDNFNSTTALDNIAEATPLSAALRIHFHNYFTWLRAFMVFARFLFVPMLGLLAVAVNVRSAEPCRRILWIFHGVFLLASLLLMVFWQVRVGWFTQFFAIAPLAWAMFALWGKTETRFQGGLRAAIKAGILLALGPLPVLLLPAAMAGTKPYPDLVFFPAARAGDTACPLKAAAEYLAESGHAVNRTYTILAGANEGPELLFRTQHNVIAANFNVPANQDVFEFFDAHDDETAIEVLRKWHVDLVLTCKSIPPFYAGFDHPRLGVNAFLHLGADGKLHLGGDPRHPALIEKLVNGQVPAWLTPVEIPAAKDYLLFATHLP